MEENTITINKYEVSKDGRWLTDGAGNCWLSFNEICHYFDLHHDVFDDLDPDERIKVRTQIGNPSSTEKNTTEGFMRFVTDFGVYSLALKSEVPEAKRFKRWLIHELLKTIPARDDHDCVNMLYKAIDVWEQVDAQINGY